MNEHLTIGGVARHTGLTVRTLRHYDRLGLLVPSRRTVAGYRLYGTPEIERLQKIVALKQLGLPLEEIRRTLDERVVPLSEVLSRQLKLVEAHIQEACRFRDRLRRATSHLQSDARLSDEQVLDLIKETTEMDKYYTPEQLEQLEARAAEVGPERIQQVQAEWKELFAAFRTEMEADSDPEGDKVQGLAARAMSLIEEFTGGDAGIMASLDSMYRKEGSAPLKRHGQDMPKELWQYYGRALATYRSRVG